MSDLIFTAIVSAGSALLGAVVAQLMPIVQYVLTRRQERRKLLREKYEEFATCAFELSVHLAKRLDSVKKGGKPNTDLGLISALARLNTLSRLYFPEMILTVQNLVTATTDYGVSLATMNTAELDAHGAAFGKAARLSLDAIQAHAKSYT